MKQIFLLSLLVISLQAKIFGQIHGENTANFDKMAEVLPLPPNAASIEKYGGVDISLYTGAVVKNLNLLNFSYKSLSVPLNLTYKSNGITVNEYASRVGMGWSFSGGGSITRIVRDKDDLNPSIVKDYPSFTFGPNDDYEAFTSFMVNTYRLNKDLQPDLFSFNFGGYSGQFVFDRNNNIVPLPVSNLKIIYNPGNTIDWTFKIIATDGTKYFFGGDTATEKTRREGYGSPNYTNFSQYMNNVWHLKKIEHPNGYSIRFSYIANEISFTEALSQTMYHRDPAADVEYVQCFDYYNNQPFPPDYSEIQTTGSIQPHVVRTKGFLLSEIRADDGSKILFQYSSAGYPEKLITKLTYYNSLGQVFKTIQFNYDIVTPTVCATQLSESTSLPFLTELLEYGDNPAIKRSYTFSYYNKNELPRRLSFAQDHWGYFNGICNTSFVPLPEDIALQQWFPDATANREPNYTYGIKGLLSEIKYPTGGRDVIEYEANTISEDQDVSIYGQSNQSAIGNTSGNFISSSGTYFTINYQHKNYLYAYCQYTGNSSYDHLHDGGQVTIVNTVTGMPVKEYAFKPYDKTYFWDFELPPGSYVMYAASRGQDIRTDVNVKYKSGTGPVIQAVNVAKGGLRVKKTTTYPEDGNSGIVKRFYYAEITDLNKSSAAVIDKPQYFRRVKETLQCTAYSSVGLCTTPTTKTLSHYALYSAPINQSRQYNGGFVNYVNVTESFGGDNFENGAMSHKFYIIPDIQAQLIRGTTIQGAPYTNTSHGNGRETESIVYKKVSSQTIPIKIKKTVFDYTDDTRKKIDIPALEINMRHQLLCVGFDQNWNAVSPFPYLNEAFDVQRYYIESVWSYLNRKTDTEYDEAGNPTMVTISDFYYDNEQHLQLTRTEVTNSKSELLKTTMTYPSDYAVTGNVYEEMVNNNIINPVIEQKTFNGSTQLSLQKTTFTKDWTPNTTLIAVKTIETQKLNNSLETRFRFNSYDAVGNPLRLQLENNIQKSYIWDWSQTVPVAEVVNTNQDSIAYSSFESNGTGNWSYSGLQFTGEFAPTGIKVYNVATGGISKTGLNTSKTYFVSYWTRNSAAFSISGTQSGYPIQGRSTNGWTYFEHKISGVSQVNITGSGLIDELRLYPAGALMTSMTYEPLAGITSQCDPNNRITYYEYDELKRLLVIRDMDRKVVKKLCYNYSGQTENCTIFYNEPQSMSFQKTDCGPNYTGSYVQYNIPFGVYVSTIGQPEANQKALDDLLANGPTYAKALGTCTPTSTCTPSNCTGVNKKCVNGVCETGVKIYTSSVFISTHYYECTYHYEWSDGSWSQNYIEYSISPCFNIE